MKSGVKLIDLTGKTFGILTVVSLNHYDPKRRRYFWNCDCSCGGKTILYGFMITSGKTKSCGCAHSTHKESNCKNHKASKEYRTWKNIKQRCYNSNIKGYENYGGRGITMCVRWLNSL